MYCLFLGEVIRDKNTLFNKSRYPQGWKNSMDNFQSVCDLNSVASDLWLITSPFLFFFIFFIFYFLYCSGFCNTLKWNSHGFTCVPYPDPPSHLPLHRTPLGLPSAPGPSTCLMHPAWAGDLFHPRQYTFRCCSLETSHPRLLPQSLKDCFIHLCLFFCSAYRVIINIFLNSIYMC